MPLPMGPPGTDVNDDESGWQAWIQGAMFEDCSLGCGSDVHLCALSPLCGSMTNSPVCLEFGEIDKVLLLAPGARAMLQGLIATWCERAI